jgi:hypothetical protein
MDSLLPFLRAPASPTTCRFYPGPLRLADHPPPARSDPDRELDTLCTALPFPKTGDKRAAILCAATKTIAEDGIGPSSHFKLS